MKGKHVLATTVVVLLMVSRAFSEEGDINLEKIVVTPSRYQEQINRTASSITIITQKEIQESAAKNILDVIRTVPGVIVRDWFGNAAKASVDIRGFGEQSGMNVLVLVDGRRINEVDLSAVDFTQIPLNQIEKIEIIRGGTAGVLYGDNATSGLINIITKRGRGKPHLAAGVEIGSYGFNEQRLGVNGSEEKFSYWFSADRQGTNGYRNNSFVKTRHFATKLEYNPASDIYLRLTGGYHREAYGLPGALSGEDIINFNHRYSKYGDDRATDKDYYVMLTAKKDFPDWGEFSIDSSYRRKRTWTNYIGANAGWNPISRSLIDTISFTPKYTLEKPIFKFDNALVSGFDYYRYDSSSDTYNSNYTLQDFSDINKTCFGGYIQDEFSILKNLHIVGGFRYEVAKYDFDYHDDASWYPDIDEKILPNKKAFNSGVVFSYRNDSSVFFNISQSFRFPATDEYFTWGSLNTSLKPQKDLNYEFGIRHYLMPKLKVELSAFRINVENELYYNPLGGPYSLGANENYDKTRHQGFELTVDSKITKNLAILINYSFLKATFLKGDYDNKEIPMVPNNKGNIRLTFNLIKDLDFNIDMNYVGPRYFINDQANAYSKINGYFTAGANIVWRYKDFSIIGAVNNIFDKDYSEFAVCNNITGAKNYYPNPRRNFSLSMDYKF